MRIAPSFMEKMRSLEIMFFVDSIYGTCTETMSQFLTMKSISAARTLCSFA